MDRERPSAGAPARRRRWDWVVAAGPGAALVVVVAATLAWAPWIPPAAPAATSPSPSIDEPADERLGGHLERVRSGMTAWVDDPAVPDPSRVRPCPDASSALDRTYTDDLEPTGINAAGGTLRGCAWTDDAAGVLDLEDRIEVSLHAEPRFSKDTAVRRLGVVTKRDGCEWASVFSERPYAALMVCETTKQRVWTLVVADDDGSGAWLITTAVGADVQWGFSTGAEVTTDLWGLVSGLDGADVPPAPAPGPQVPRMDREFVELVEALAARPQPASMGGSGGRSCLNATGALTSALDVGLYAVAEPGATPSDPLCWWTVGTPPTNDAEFARTLSFAVAVDGTADLASHRAYVDTGAQEIVGPGGPGRPDRCLSSDLPLSEVRTTVLACSLDGHVRWSVIAASPDGTELWVLDADVPASSGADPSSVMLSLVDVADESW